MQPPQQQGQGFFGRISRAHDRVVGSQQWRVISQVICWTSFLVAAFLLIVLPLSGFQPHNIVWSALLANPSSWGATFAGVMGTYLSRMLKLWLRPTEEEREAMGGRHFWAAIKYGSISLTPLALLFLVGDLFGGFWLAGLLVVRFYHFPATQDRKNAVLAWWQNLPGVVLYFLRTLGVLGKKPTEEEATAERAKLRRKAASRSRLYQRLPDWCYYVGTVTVLVGSVIIIIRTFVVMHSGFASGPHPSEGSVIGAIWSILTGAAFDPTSVGTMWEVRLLSVLTGLAFGWLAFWGTTTLIWVLYVGVPRSREDLLGYCRTVFFTLVAIILGPFSQLFGYGMVALTKGGMIAAQQTALFVVYSQVGGNLLILIPLAFQLLGVGGGGDDE